MALYAMCGLGCCFTNVAVRRRCHHGDEDLACRSRCRRRPIGSSTVCLFYGYPGRRLVGYDNERTKGDHKHLDDMELACAFVSVEQLVSDFLADIRRIRGSL